VPQSVARRIAFLLAVILAVCDFPRFVNLQGADMKSILRCGLLAGLTLLANAGNAEDRVPWAADFNTACGMAAEQRRLVLLHFYNDNCGPCVRVDQNVFSRPEVADAVSQSHVAVKVHAGKNPQLASKYHVNQWPTDVFVTASGLEVFRTVSPQKPTDYIAVLNQVANHAGIGSGRLANNPLNTIAQASPKAQSAVGAASAGLTGALAAAEQRVHQSTADAQRAAAEAQQKWNATTQQAQNTVNQAQTAATSVYQQAATAATQGEQQVAAAGQQAAASATAAVQHAEQQSNAMAQQAANTAQQAANTAQQAANTVQQAANTANQWENQAASAVQGYEQQATTAYQQARDRATQAGQQVEQQADTTKQQWQTAASQTAQEVNTAAQNLKQQASALGSSLLDRRSAFMPVETSPAAAATSPAAPPAQSNSAATPALAAAPATSPAVLSANAAVAATSPPPAPALPKIESAPTATVSPPALTSNPYVASKPAEKTPTSTSPPPSNTATSLAQAYTNATAAAPAAVQASALFPAQQPSPPANTAASGNHQMVPVSQAPPVGLDGFCPVTLVETMSKNPSDKNAWKKGDRRFGAIHKGRTYLFTSAENQQKFLQNADAFAPILSGCDPVVYAEHGQMVDGKRAFGLVTTDKHIYLFADEASRSRFEKSPASYLGALQQAMARNNQSASIYR
jgi:YHS domain-containing protein/thiol-disulfide isomerase/thioredoxin